MTTARRKEYTLGVHSVVAPHTPGGFLHVINGESGRTLCSRNASGWRYPVLFTNSATYTAFEDELCSQCRREIDRGGRNEAGGEL